MNNPGDDINAGLHQRLSRRRNFQLLRDIVTSYNENIRVNNQYMIEYIQSMQDIINYMRDMNNRDELYYEQLRRTRPRRPPPPPPSPRTHFNPINGHPPINGYPSVPVTPSNRNIRNMSLGEFIQGIAQDTETTPALSTETDNNNNNNNNNGVGVTNHRPVGFTSCNRALASALVQSSRVPNLEKHWGDYRSVA